MAYTDIPEIPPLDAGRNLNNGQRFKDEATLEEILEAIRTNMIDGEGPLGNLVAELTWTFNSSGV
jgi:hypothetical protein